MFNYKKVDNLELQVEALKCTNSGFSRAVHARDTQIIALQNELKVSEAEKVSKYKALSHLVDRYVNTMDFPVDYLYFNVGRGISDNEYTFEKEVESRERDKINRAERAKIESIVRDLLKKNVFKEVKE